MKMNYYLRLVVILVTAGLLVTSCSNDKDKDPQVVPVEFTVRLMFHVDQAPLMFSQFNFQNEAGNTYSVEKMQFYLSAFRFERYDGSEVSSDELVYVDARAGKNIIFKLKNIPSGIYKSVAFLIGLDSLHNVTNALPPTIENVNMAWPDGMGGGYHFMKFEGNFMDSGNSFGFAMHLGKNAHLVHAGVSKNISITVPGDILTLRMNLNEWFRNPHVYDFNTDGNYSMGSDAAMLKLAQNGIDVFYE